MVPFALFYDVASFGHRNGEMSSQLIGSLSGLLPFIAYFLLAMVLLAIFIRLYIPG